jgi:hypothetical protein
MLIRLRIARGKTTTDPIPNEGKINRFKIKTIKAIRRLVVLLNIGNLSTLPIPVGLT